MTRQQFLDQFYIDYDQVADQAAPGYSPLELSRIASEAQENLITVNYNSKSNKLQEGFEETEKRISDLGELVRYKTYTTFSAGFLDNSFDILLPNTLITNGPTDYSDVYWFTILETCKASNLDCSIPGNTIVYVSPTIVDITHGELVTALKDPFRKPYIKGNSGKVLRLRSEGRKHSLITDGSFTITNYTVGYIKKPQPIDLTTNLNDQVSELSDQKQREILRATITQCLAITEQPQKLTVDNSIPKE